MLAEYIAASFPGARVINRQRLGPDGATFTDERLTAEERKLLGAAFRRWADAIVIDRGVLLVIEASMLANVAKIAQASLYLHLVDVTPELQEFRTLPRRGRLVWAVDDQYSRAVAIKAGLEVALFRPSNFSAWLTSKRISAPRQSRPTVTKLDLETPAGTAGGVG